VITRALILAAGRGLRIGDHDGPNCLARVGRYSLIERTLRVLAAAGIRQVGITLGWQASHLRRFLLTERDLPGELGLELALFENTAWEKPNGVSVQAARAFVDPHGNPEMVPKPSRDGLGRASSSSPDAEHGSPTAERTLLVMADQIAAPSLIGALVRAPAHGERSVLCVDRDLARVFDIDDATKVKLGPSPANSVEAISKDLGSYDAISVGLFVMAPSLLAAIDGLGEASLTRGVQAAAEQGMVEAHDVGTQLWQDVDSRDMRQHAEWLLRVYGDELARPAMRAIPPSAAEDTLALVERLMADKDLPGRVLLNPGPVMTSARVKASLVHHDVCHRDEDYSGVLRRLEEKLRPIFRASLAHEVLPVTGSGTAAMEMAITAAVPPGKKLLVISNGSFGERLTEIANLHHIPVVELKYRWGELPHPEDVARALGAEPDLGAVAMIQHETSVGLLNPVGAVGALCRRQGVTLVVDSVSALGAEDVDVVRDGVGICFSSSNKCLHSVSGVSFLCVAPEVWAELEKSPPRVYYLDLLRYRRVKRDSWQTPFTPAVSALFALETALDELAEEGGVPARREIYRKRNLRIRRVFADLGFESFTNTGRESHTICTLRLPDPLEVTALYDQLKERGFVIYRCKGALAARHIQVANMGELPDATIDAFLAAVTEVVAEARRRAEAAAPTAPNRRALGGPGA
jgi:2-aminoethylphosphonate-pyruvate transaminase